MGSPASEWFTLSERLKSGVSWQDALAAYTPMMCHASFRLRMHQAAYAWFCIDGVPETPCVC